MPGRRRPAGAALLILGVLLLSAGSGTASEEPGSIGPGAPETSASAPRTPLSAFSPSPPGVNTSDQRQPDIAVDGARAHLVWVSNDSGRERVYHAWSLDLGNWSQPRPLAPLAPGANASEPRVAATSGRVYVVWRETHTTATTIAFSASVDAGGNFTRSGNLTTAPLPPSTTVELSIAASGDDLHVAWSFPTPDGGDTVVRTSNDAGLSLLPAWTAPGAGPQTSPSLARSPATLLLAWEDGRNGEADIFASVSADRGATFSLPSPAFPDQAGKAQRTPQASFAYPATWWLGWEDEIAGKSYANVSWAPEVPSFPAGRRIGAADISSGSFEFVTGTGHASWIDGTIPQVLAARRLDESYSNPQRVGNATGPESDVSAAGYHNGSAILVWQDSMSGDLDIRITALRWRGPDVAVLSPSPGALVWGAGTVVSWDSTDIDGVDPAGTNLSWSKDLFSWTLTSSGLGKNGSRSWVPTPLFDGPAYLRVTAGDGSGNRGSAVILIDVDSVPPAAIAFDPVQGAQGVPVGSSISITFSEPMEQPSVQQNFTLTERGVLLPGSSAWIGDRFTFDPTGPVPLEGRKYRIQLPAASDLAGNPTQSRIEYEFTTDDTTPPAVALTSPTAKDKWKLGSNSITWNVSDAGLILPGSVDLDYSTDDGLNWSTVAHGLNNTGAYDWSVPPQISTSLARVMVRVTDLVGNVGNDTSSRFVIDSIPPFIASSDPKKNLTGVEPNVRIRVNLSEPVIAEEVNASARLESKGPTINCGVTWSDPSSFTCSAGVNLSSATVYYLNFTTHDDVGNRLDGTLWFRTKDSTPPVIIILAPKSSDLVNGATAFEIRYQYVDQTVHRPNSFTISRAYGNPKDFITITSVWNDPTKYFWRPDEIIEESASYIQISVRDADGNFGSNISPAFRVDTIRPFVVGVEPKNGTNKVPLEGPVKFEFNEPMSSARANASINVAGISLKVNWETKITLSITPSRALAPDQQFGILLSDASDEAGNTISSPYRYAATTTAAPDPAQARGIVVSSDGALLQGVTVIAKLQPGDKIENTTETNRQGVFTMGGITPGNYSFSFQLAGYQTRILDHSLPPGGPTYLPDVIMFSSGPTLPVYLPIYVLVLAVIGLLVLFVVISRRVKSSAEGEELKAYLRTAPGNKAPPQETMEDDEPRDDAENERKKPLVKDIVDTDEDSKRLRRNRD